MNKIITFFSLLVLISVHTSAQLSFSRTWERSDSAYTRSQLDANKKPVYFDNMNTRGIAVGKINTANGPVERVFLPSRHETGNVVRVLDAETGADIKSLDMTGVDGGGFIISDAGVTEDGVLLVSNCTHSSSGPFKIYKYTHEDQPSTLEISFPSGTARYGDKITVTGNYNDGTARIYAIAGAALSNYKVQYFGMEQVNGNWKFKQTPDELNTAITAASSNFHQINPGPDGGYYFRSVGLNNFQQIKADLTANTGNTHPATMAQGGTTPVYITSAGGFDYACYLRYGSHATYAGPANNKVEIVKTDRTQGISSAIVVATGSSMGKLAPGNGAGNVVVKKLPNGDADIYALSTQNGISRYRLTGLTSGIYPVIYQILEYSIADDEIAVKGNDISTLEIFSISGQKISATSNQNSISVKGLQGCFIIRACLGDKEFRTAKIIL